MSIQTRISVLASGVPGFWALLAAATDARIASAQIDQTPYSFQPALDGPVHHSLHDAIIGGFSLQFDIADVVGAMNGRPVFWTHPTDWLQNPVPQDSALGVSVSHTGNFIQGQPNAAYTLVVSNAAGAMMTGGPVTVTENLPAGLSLVSMTGAGWNCVSGACTRSDSLMPGLTYPAIAVTVNVAGNAPPSLLNALTVSGGGSVPANATDPTTIIQNPPVLKIAKTHVGNFGQGQLGTTYTLTISNAVNAGATNGTVTVAESVPAGLVLVSMSGPGWSCSASSCARTDALAAGSNYPPLTVTVNVTPTATSTQVNMASVSGGGSVAAAASDSTSVIPKPAVLSIAKSHTGTFSQGGIAIYHVTVSNASGAGVTSGVVTATENPPPGLTLVSMAGVGWTCAATSCSRSDPLNAGSSFPDIIVSAKVAFSAPSPLINSVNVKGGGSVDAGATDSATIVPVATLLSLSRGSLNFTTNGLTITDPQTITLSFTGDPGVAWTVSSNRPGILPSPSSGNGNGSVQIAVSGGNSGVVTITAPRATNSPQNIQVNVSKLDAGAPWGSFDTPLDKSTGIVGAIPVTGWALDNIEVSKVDIWREPVATEPPGLVYIGDAVLVNGARPDLEAANPTVPFSYRAGWGYLMLTTGLPNNGGSIGSGNGTYKLHAIAHNTTGSATDLGVRNITCDNAHATKPFGSIDTPGQGEVVSGNAYVNFGWALTQNPNVIPKDGSTITVTIDGQPIGGPTYNQFRSDIANAFPGLQNSGGAVGYLFIDTTSLANGVHTIGWVVYDNAGRGDGIGSRFFSVLNPGGNHASAPVPIMAHDRKVMLTGGFDTTARSIAPSARGVYEVDIQELDRIVLDAGVTGGHLLVNNEQRSLPAGSSLRDGVFYWQTAAGFLGSYDFVLTDQKGTPLRVEVRIRPKRY